MKHTKTIKLEGCKGCSEIVYTPKIEKSWCWLTTKEISQMSKCPKQSNKDKPHDEIL